jgi:O-antigen/teichoic acid export membrane protein
MAVLRRILTFVPGTLVPAVLTLVTSMIFTRIFDPIAFGLYAIFLVGANPAKIVATTWLTQSLGRFLPSEQSAEGRRRVKDAVFVSTTAILIVETVIGGLVLAGLRGLLPVAWRPMLLPTVAFVMVSSMFDVLSLVFPSEYRAAEYTLYRVIDSIATLGLRLLLVTTTFRMGVESMFWSVVLVQGLLGPLMWWRLGFPSPLRLLAVLRREDVRRTLRAFLDFGPPMTMWFFSSVLLDVGDRYVLSFLLGPAPVGVYDASYRLIAGLAAMMVVPLTVTLHPYLMSLSGSGDDQHLAAVVGRVIENLLLLGTLCVGVTFLLHADLARFLLGEQFRSGSVIMPVVLAGVFLFNVGTFAHKPFEIAGRPWVMVAFGLVSAGVNTTLCFALIPLFGYMGAAWATLAAYGTYTVCVGLLGRRLVAWRLDLRHLLGQGSAIVACFILVALCRSALEGVPYLANLAITVLACAAPAAVFVHGLLRKGMVPREL